MSTNQSKDFSQELVEDLDLDIENIAETQEAPQTNDTESDLDTVTAALSEQPGIELSDQEIAVEEMISEVAGTEPPDNLVPISHDIDPAKNPIYNKLEQLINLVKERNEVVDDRLDVIEPITEALTESTVDLGMRTEELEQAQKSQFEAIDTRLNAVEPLTEELMENSVNLGMRAEDMEQAHKELAERTANLATATDTLRVENDRRSEALEAWTKQLEQAQNASNQRIDGLTSHSEKLQQQANEAAENIVHLEGKASELEQMDYQLSDELDAERSRINKLTPRMEIMEDTADELLRDAADLKEETGEIRKFFKTATWSIAAVALILAIATGTLYWLQNKNVVSIDQIMADLGIQKEKIVAVEEIATVMYSQLKEVPAQIQAVYQQMEQKDSQLDSQISSVSQEVKQANAEIADLKERIFIPDENLSTGAIDLSIVKNDTWLLEQNENHYTIQIVGVYGKNALANYIGRYRKHLDVTSLSYLETTYKGRDWYVLLHGSYPSLADAQSAMDGFSDSLQKNSPYVRQFKRIHERVGFRTAGN